MARRGPGRGAAARSRSKRPADVYSQMVAEDVPASPRHNTDGRPLKRRKTRPESPIPKLEDTDTDASHLEGPSTDRTLSQNLQEQAVYDESSGSSASDFDFEDVDLGVQNSNQDKSAIETVGKDLSIELDARKKTPSKGRRRVPPSSRAERMKRLDVHKMHLCCLLSHVFKRNAWCNDRAVQASLKPLLSTSITSYLNPDRLHSQFRRSATFEDGLQQAMDVFKNYFIVSANCLRRPPEELLPSSERGEATMKASFARAAKAGQGSRHTGAQLFCALLRSVGVDTRLVCSLQPLPFVSVAPKQAFSEAETKISADNLNHAASQATSSGLYSRGSSTELSDAVSNRMPRRVRRFGQHSARHGNIDLGRAPSSPAKPTPLPSSSYPIYWVEVFNDALQKWIPVDPLVTGIVGKANKFEPPANDALNRMSYVVAFEDDGTVQDVTRRYTKAYNAKTRRSRVEATKAGQKWWRSALKIFDSGMEADRDAIERAELAHVEASEPMPRNVQDFKDHPYYALERHLRSHEVIHPKKEIGKVTTGNRNPVLEPIYRRQDVQMVKSAQKWYREGRVINPFEQPLKYHLPQRTRRRRTPTPAAGDSSPGEDNPAVTLYALQQTSLYIPSAVTSGRVPRNAHGNIDVYTPSMIPRGGVHIRASEGPKASKILKIDYADAVVGFEFKARRGTPVLNGVVVARDFAEAIVETVTGLRFAREEVEREKRSKLAIRLWRRFLTALRIIQRVKKYASEDEGDVDVRKEVDENEAAEKEVEEQGGFFPDLERETMEMPASNGEVQETAAPTVNDFDAFERDTAARGKRQVEYDGMNMCILSPWDDANDPLTAVRATNAEGRQLKKVPGSTVDVDLNPDEHENVGGGGFVPDGHDDDMEDGGLFADDEPGGGGFMPEDESAAPSPAQVDVKPKTEGNQGQEDDATATSEFESADNRISSTQEAWRADAGHDRDRFADDRDADRDAYMSGALQSDFELEHVQQQMEPDCGMADSAPLANESELCAMESVDDGSAEGSDGSDGSLLSHDPEDDDAEPDWL